MADNPNVDTDHLWSLAQSQGAPQQGYPLDSLWASAGGDTGSTPSAPAQSYSYSGHAFEQLYNNFGPYYRIAKAFGVAAEQNFGAQELPDPVRNYLQSNGLLKDFSDLNTELHKSSNSVFFWPNVIGTTSNFLATQAPVRALIAATTSIPALLAGTAAATQQVGTEFLGAARSIQETLAPAIGNTAATAIATPVGGAGEILGAVPEGFIGDSSFPRIATHMSTFEDMNYHLHNQLDRMRSEGVIGEDDGTYFGTREPTPEQRQARAEAARNVAQSQRPDVHTVARQMAPDIMGPYDDLVRYREDLLEAKRSQTQINPDWADKNQELEDHLAKGPGTGKNRAYHEAKLREELSQIPRLQPLENAEELDRELHQTNQQIAELSNKVKDVYSRASEALGSRVAGVQDLGDTQGTPEQAPVPEAPIAPVGEKPRPIADQVFDNLKEINERLRKPLTDDQLQIQADFSERIYRTLGKMWGVDPHVLFREKFPELTTEAPEGAKPGSRGSVTFRPGQRDLLHLAETSDPTTFMHELFHHYAKLIEHIAFKGDAPPELVGHYNVLRTWLNAKEGLPLTDAQHERGARGFEKYLMEGHAPTPELAHMFATIKQWFVDVYKQLKNLRVQINDPIRGFFNQMIKEGPEDNGRVNVAPEDRQDIIGRTGDQPVTAAIQTPQKATDDLPPQPDGVPVTSQSGMTLNQSDYIGSDGKPNIENSVRSDADMEKYVQSWALHNNKYRDDGLFTFTHSDILELADVYGVRPANMERNVARLAKMFPDNKVPVTVRVRALGDLLKANDQAMKDAAINGDIGAVASAAENRLNIQRTMQGVRTNWAQIGHALNTLAIEEKQSEMLSQLYQNSIGRTAEDLEKDARRIKELDTQAKIAAYGNKMVTASYGQMLEEAFKQFLISGPLTHLQYIEGNRIMSVMRAGPETYASALIADLREAITGKKSLPGQRNYWDTGTLGIKSMLFHQADGLRAMADAAKAGQTVLLPGESAASTPFSGTKYIPGVAGTIIRAPGERMVAAIHSADRTINFHIAKDQLDHNQARDEGFDPAKDPDGYAQRIAELKANATPQRLADSSAVANEIALMSRAGSVTRAVMGFTNLETDLPVLGLTKPMNFITPFVHIAGNLGRQGVLERSPLGYAFSRIIREDLHGKNGTLAQDAAFAKLTIGTAVWGALGGLFAMGHLNGPPPDDYKQAAVNLGKGIMPYSIQIGHTTFAFDRLGAWGQQMAMGATLWAAFKDHETEGWGNALALFGEHFLKHITTEGYMQSISDMFKAVDNPDQYGGRWANNFLASFAVPTVSRQIAGTVDPYQREAKGLWDTIKSRIPFASETLPAQIDLLGNPIPNKEFYGVYARHLSEDPMWQVITKSGYSFGPVPRQIRGIQLSSEQHEDYARMAGAQLQLLLKKIVDNGAWQNMPQTTLYETIAGQNGMVAASRKAAQGYMIAKYHFGDKTIMQGDDIGSIALKKKQGLIK